MAQSIYPPGPDSGFFGMGSLKEFDRDPLGFLHRLARDYPNDIVYHKFGPYPSYMLNHPGLIRQMLVKDAKSFYKWDRMKKVLGKFAGQGILTSDGDYWKRQRRLVQPAFHTQRIKHYAEIMAQYTEDMLDDWEDGGVYDLAQEMTSLTMGIIARVLFDVDTRGPEAADLTEAITITQEMSMIEMTHIFYAPDWMPTPRNRLENRAMQYLRDYLLTIIRERRATGKDKGDLLSMLLLAEDEDGNSMTDEQVYDEAVTLFIAGHETTSNGLCWMWYLLSQHPEIEQKLYAEVTSVLKGRTPTLEDLETMTYTDMVFKEAMRLYPPVWMFQRQAIETVKMGDFNIEKDSVVYVSPWVIHNDARFWDSPAEFRPERFAPENKDAIQDYAYFPFGGGPRVCIGNHLAMMESEIITATITRHFKLDLLPDQEIVPEPLITLRPKHGLKMRVERRKDA